MSNMDDDIIKEPFDLDEKMRKAFIDELGRLITNARDQTILEWDKRIDGDTSFQSWVSFNRLTSSLNQESREAVKSLLPLIVDTYIYRILAEIDASEKVDVSVRLGAFRVGNVARISWGLTAEPVGNEGWFQRFSRQRHHSPGEE